jgi:hypothetical protein
MGSTVAKDITSQELSDLNDQIDFVDEIVETTNATVVSPNNITVQSLDARLDQIINPSNALYTDAPFDSEIYGRQNGAWVGLGYRIDYTYGCGDEEMACGEPTAACGEYTGFTLIV